MFPHTTDRRFHGALRQNLPGSEALEQRRLLSMVDLDPHFDVGQPLGNDYGKVRVVSQLADGKILAAGSFVDRGKVLRFMSDGGFDDTFGVGGVATVNFHPYSAALQSDGKIVLAGVNYNHSEGPFDVARLTADGLMDTTFGSGGIVNLPSLAHMNPWVGAADVADDGKIVILANGSDYVNLIRLTTAGALDTTFDGDGITEIPDAYGTDIAVQNDGRIVIAGAGFRAARVTAAGALDATFGSNGFVRGTGTFDGECLAIQNNGSIIVGAGRSLQLSPIIRLMPSGAFDREFQDSTPDANDDFVSDLLIDPATGKLLAVKARAGSSDLASIERFNTDGTLDLSLNEGEPLAATAGVLAMTAEGGFLIGPHRVYYDGGDNFQVQRYRVRPDMEVDSTGTLYLSGTAADDTISVRINPANSSQLLVSRNGNVFKIDPFSAVLGINVMTAAGNDTFTSSLAAPALVYAGLESDSVATGTGQDTVYDGGGNDTVNTGAGNDFIHSGESNGQFYTGDGNDTVRLLDADSVNAGDGNDSIHTDSSESITISTPIAVDLGGGDDLFNGNYIVTRYVVTGGSGNDQIYLNSRADTVDAGAGDDTVSSSGGDDRIDGGAGNDLLQGWAGNDFVSGGDGDDTLLAGNYHGGAFPTESNTLMGGAGNDRIEGADGPDLLVGNGGNDRIRGFGGADRIYGRAGVDRLDGGAGGDRIYGDAGDDFLLEGGPGNDRIYGGLGDDSICGGSGDDELYCGGGADTLIGNKGNDLLSAADSASDLLDGGRGLDSATIDDDTLDGMTSIEQLL